MATNPYDQPRQWNQPPTYPSQGGVQPRESPCFAQEPRAAIDPLGATPLADVVDNEDELWVYLDLPGFDQDELQVRGDERTIVVNARRFGDVEEGRQFLVNERPTRFERTISLPTSVDVDEANVSYERGVCKITLPKEAAEQYQEIHFETT